MSRNLYALLVGIDAYPEGVPQLYGAVNDINAFEAYLSGRMMDGEFNLHLLKLLDSQATRQGVIDGFRKHLKQAGPQDVALFYYTGHGSQEVAPEEFRPIEPDMMNETLVCFDSRTSAGSDLADKEIALLIAEVEEKNPHFVIIMDCCHSGSGTRDAQQFNSIRQAPTDTRQRPIESYLFPKERMMAARAQAEAPKGKSSGWQSLPNARHVLLAACQDIQTAKEHIAESKSWGAFSFFLRNALESANGPLTYRDLFKQAQARVRASVRDQNPQLESSALGDLDLPFLGGAVRPRPNYFTVSFDGAAWVLDGGAIHGLPGPIGMDTTQLSLFDLAATTADLSDPAKAIGQAQVLEVRPDTSLVEPFGFTPDEQRTYKAVVTALPLPLVGVRLEGDEAGLALVRQAFTNSAPGGGPSLYVQEQAESPRLRVKAENGEFTITRFGDEKLLTSILTPYDAPAALKVVQRLEHIARWMRTSELNNPATYLPHDAVSMEFLQGDQSLELQDLRFSYIQEAGRWKQPSCVVKIRNNADRVLHCTILDLDEHFAVSVLFTQQPVIRLEPGQEYQKEVFLAVPEIDWRRGVTEVRDVFKLVACSEPFDATLLAQDELDRPPAARRSAGPQVKNTLNRMMNYLHTRAASDRPEEDTIADWFTAEAIVSTQRPLDTQPVPSSGAAVPLGPGVSLEPHPALAGRARLGSQAPTMRDLGDPGLPAVFQSASPELPPFYFRLTRSAAPAENVLELHQVLDHRAVTVQAPLRLNLLQPLGSGEHLLAYAYDGEFFLPLGAARNVGRQAQVEIQRLPAPISQGVRDLGGSIRILFQKLLAKPLGLNFPYPILAEISFGPEGQPVYQADPAQVRGRVQTARTITLYIHGFSGDSRGMVASARSTNRDDLILAFDYESINTPIPEIARQLKERLQAIGLGPGHGKRLRLVVHSMGGVVSRWFIEREGGKEIIQHLVIVGSPSAGVPWASLQQYATVGLTLALNGLAPVAWPAQALSAFLTAFEKVDVTLDQLQPGSQVFQDLASSPDPSVPYTLIAGNTSIIPEAVKGDDSKMARLMKTLGYDLFSLGFSGLPNDFVVGVSSVFAIPGGRTPAPTKVEIACDHITYFTNPISLEALKQVLVM